MAICLPLHAMLPSLSLRRCLYFSHMEIRHAYKIFAMLLRAEVEVKSGIYAVYRHTALPPNET